MHEDPESEATLRVAESRLEDGTPVLYVEVDSTVPPNALVRWLGPDGRVMLELFAGESVSMPTAEFEEMTFSVIAPGQA